MYQPRVPLDVGYAHLDHFLLQLVLPRARAVCQDHIMLPQVPLHVKYVHKDYMLLSKAVCLALHVHKVHSHLQLEQVQVAHFVLLALILQELVLMHVFHAQQGHTRPTLGVHHVCFVSRGTMQVWVHLHAFHAQLEDTQLHQGLLHCRCVIYAQVENISQLQVPVCAFSV